MTVAVWVFDWLPAGDSITVRVVVRLFAATIPPAASAPMSAPTSPPMRAARVPDARRLPLGSVFAAGVAPAGCHAADGTVGSASPAAPAAAVPVVPQPGCVPPLGAPQTGSAP